MKPRVILDVGFLGHAHDEKSARRGAQRVARHIFEGVLASSWCELSFVATSHLAGAYDFIQSRGIAADEKMFFQPAQLSRSRLGRKITRSIHRTIENRALPMRAGRRVLAGLAGLCLRGEALLSPAWLDRADIYHSPHTPFPAAVHQQPRLKKFLTCHDFIPLKNPEYFPGDTRPFMEAVLACLQPQNFACCVSETTRNDVLNFSKMPPERVFVTPLAADPEIFHPVTQPQPLAAAREKYRLGDEPYFLALSAHDRHKNFVHLIECFGALVESGELSGHNLVIVGPNPGRNPAAQQALAGFPRARSRIIIPGYVPDEELAAIYSGATAFLFPSLAEGFGIPPLEAMQCGVPVIASNTTSIPEVVGDAGLLLPPTERDGWCQAMLKIARDANLRSDLAQRSLVRAKLFSWQRFTDETLRGYQASLAMK
jgi:glycosyltransferase involved in cell wall biosynthesis